MSVARAVSCFYRLSRIEGLTSRKLSAPVQKSGQGFEAGAPVACPISRNKGPALAEG